MRRGKRILCFIISFMLILSCIPINEIMAASNLPSSLYLTQEGTSTCTLSSAAMMLRARMYLSGNSAWDSVTESTLSSSAWIAGSGLRWGFTYTDNSNSITVSRTASSGLTSSKLKSILDEHEEGIVLYCGKLPHAVFLTDYNGDIFYCADTIAGYSGSRITLSSSYLGKKYGSQSAILNNVTAYWYVSSYSIDGNTNHNPTGLIDSCTGGLQSVQVQGWVFDSDSTATSLDVHVYIGGPAGSGAGCYIIKADEYRPDVNGVYGVGDYHGYSATLTTNLSGEQSVYVYAINVGEGNDNPLLGEERVAITPDTQAPVIDSVSIIDIDETGYTVVCTVTDNTGVKDVKFPTWTEPLQDDLLADWSSKAESSGQKNGDVYSYRVKISDHNNEMEGYITHIYAWDNYDNSVGVTIKDFGIDAVNLQSTVTYNANGGRGAPSSQIKTHGTAITLSKTVPERFGYTFLGWSKSSSATTPTYLPGGTFSIDANTTLYAVWASARVIASDTHRDNFIAPVTFANGYVIYSFVPATTAEYQFRSLGTSVDTQIFIYDELGNQLYSDDDGGTNRNFKLLCALTAGREYYIKVKVYSGGTGDVVFTIRRGYTISYNANGGINAPDAQTKIDGEDLVLSTSQPTREGYVFLGWCAGGESGNPNLFPGDTLSINEDLVLYAVWQPNGYNVIYDLNGGNDGPADQYKYHDRPIKLNTTVPTRNGYEFCGWATTKTATKAEYQPGDEYNLNGDVILYAVWSANINSLYYDVNGGTTNIPTVLFMGPGQNQAVTNRIPCRVGYTFKGWAVQEDAVQPQYQPGDVIWVEGNVVLYAVWEIETYKITFDTMGGDPTPVAQYKTYGVDVKLTMLQPVREGYTFMGWSIYRDSITGEYAPGDILDLNFDVTLYAIWIHTPSYVITFKDYDGSIISVESYNLGAAIKEPSAPQRPADNVYSYTFAGWDKEVVDCNGDAVYTATYSKAYIIYTVNFLDWDGATIAVHYYHWGDSIDAPKDPARSEDAHNTYEFLAWVTPRDFDGYCYGNITLTAEYKVYPKNALQGWQQVNGKWYFYENGIKVSNGWRRDSVGWCYLGEDGAMLTDTWKMDSVGWCYIGSSGYIVYNKWVADSKGWCYVGADGYMVTNKWVRDSVGWCYIGAEGYCLTSAWQKDSKGWCYLDSNGCMVYSKWVADSKGWCYVGSNGYMVTNCWVQDSKGWCYVGADGYVVTNCWKQDSIGWCYLGANGSMTKGGWIKDGTNWYYCDDNGYMVTNTIVINGKTYYFHEYGVCMNPGVNGPV